MLRYVVLHHVAAFPFTFSSTIILSFFNLAPSTRFLTYNHFLFSFLVSPLLFPTFSSFCRVLLSATFLRFDLLINLPSFFKPSLFHSSLPLILLPTYPPSPLPSCPPSLPPSLLPSHPLTLLPTLFRYC